MFGIYESGFFQVVKLLHKLYFTHKLPGTYLVTPHERANIPA